jgi:hypothetical protein
MVTKKYQFWTNLLSIASILVLISTLPQSYAQGGAIEQQQIDEEDTLINEDWPIFIKTL